MTATIKTEYAVTCDQCSLFRRFSSEMDAVVVAWLYARTHNAPGVCPGSVPLIDKKPRRR